MTARPPPRTHGTGLWMPGQLAGIGEGTIIEDGVMIFHPGQIRIGQRVYIGHRTILKGYHRNEMSIGDDSWVGQDCFFHSAGGITIGKRVGVGPGVKIITSKHQEAGTDVPILWSPLEFQPVTIADDCDIGIGAILLPGISLGQGCQVGAGAVVSRSFPAFAVIAGVPARQLRLRTSNNINQSDIESYGF